MTHYASRNTELYCESISNEAAGKQLEEKNADFSDVFDSENEDENLDEFKVQHED